MKTKLEKDEEGTFIKFVKKSGGRTRKMNGLGFRFWPDRLVITPYGFSYWVEFKRPGLPLTDGQQELHRILAELGYLVTVEYTAQSASEFYVNVIEHLASFKVPALLKTLVKKLSQDRSGNARDL